MSAIAQQHRAEKCADLHEAIAAGRTALLPVAGIWSHEQKAFAVMFRCPNCAGPVYGTVK
jgi:hypothetical protein